MQILLVEDSPEVSLITVEYLNELGHEVVAVSDAEIALSKIAEQPFDAVITDVSLPGMSGIDLAKELARHYPTLPVVIASGYGSIKIENLLGEKRETIFVLTKPYDMSTLEATLAEAAAIKRSA